MKYSASLSLLLLFGILVSCQNENKQEAFFDYLISGKVEGAEGVELALYIPSQGLDNRLKSEIKDGHYRFKGRATNIEECEILFEENVINESPSFSFTSVFLEPGEVTLNFEVKGEMLNHYTEHIKVIRGSINKFYYETLPVFWSYARTRIFEDPVKSDSMHRFIYPTVKQKTFSVYDSLLAKTKFPAVSLSFLSSMTRNSGAFQYDRLNPSEISRINSFFQLIDSTKVSTHAYKITKSKIATMANQGREIVFKDFVLSDVAKKDINLSSLIKQNDITLLYFWWSGCVPCRKFNRETSNAKYQALKKAGIEIISISVDDSWNRWEKASADDSIKWVNLYAGAISSIAAEYQVQVFPTKFLFDSNLHRIDFDFNDAAELLELKE